MSLTHLAVKPGKANERKVLMTVSHSQHPKLVTSKWLEAACSDTGVLLIVRLQDLNYKTKMVKATEMVRLGSLSYRKLLPACPGLGRTT